jgi:circadian clock protein KaiC
LVGEYTKKLSRVLPEFATADGIVELLRTAKGTRDERFIRVLKLRGSSYLEGSHSFKITGDGLEVFPRLVTPEVPKDFKYSKNRVTTGIEGLDELLDGGFLEGSTTLLAGPTGSGKTTFALQFLIEGVRQGVPGLYVNFEENPTQLERTINGLGGDLQKLKAEGLHFLYASPVELQMDSIIVQMFSRIDKLGIKRIVIDAIGDLITTTTDGQRLHDYIYALTQHFTVKGVTTIVTFETLGGPTDFGTQTTGGGRFSYMSDNIILLKAEVTNKIERSILILKERASAHDENANEMEIGASGVRIKNKQN